MANKEESVLAGLNDLTKDSILGYIDESEDSPDISLADRLAIKRLDVPPEDAKVWLERKYPELDVALRDGEVHARPKGKLIWKPMDSPKLNTNDARDFLNDFIEGGVSAAASYGGPLAEGVIGGLANALRQKEAESMGISKFSPARVAEVAALSSLFPVVGKYSPKIAASLGAKFGKKIPESVWKNYAQNYDKLKGFVKGSAEEVAPQIEQMAKRTGETFSSAWDKLGGKVGSLYQKAADEVPSVNTADIINSLQDRLSNASKTAGESTVSALSNEGSGIVREFQKGLGKSVEALPQEVGDRLVLGVKETFKIPETKAVSEKKALSFWSKVDESLRDQMIGDLQRAGIDPTKNIPKLVDNKILAESSIKDVPVYNVLNPESTGADLVTQLKAFRDKVPYNDQTYGAEAQRIISSGMGDVKDKLFKSASEQTRKEFGDTTAKIANMEQIPDIFYGKTRALGGGEVGTKVDPTKVGKALKSTFSNADKAVNQAEINKLIQAAPEEYVSQLTDDLTAMGMRSVEDSGNALASQLGSAGGAAAGYSLGGPSTAAVGAGLGYYGGSKILSPKIIRDYGIPASILTKKAAENPWSRMLIQQTLKNLTDKNKTSEE